MGQTRVAFVGAGAVAERHLRTVASFPDVSVVGVCDPVAERVAALRALSDARGYAERAALLDSERPDAVYVCVPPFAHGAPERELIARGIPFFVEKPLAAGLAEAAAVGAEVAAAGLVTAVGYHWRNLEGVDRAAVLLAERPARLAVAAWLDKVPPPAWWIRREASGGQTVEQTTHLVDTLVALLGEVSEVYAVAARTERPAFPDADVDDVTSATLRFASGAVGSLASTSLLRAKRRAGIELIGDGLRLELSEGRLHVEDGAGTGESFEEDLDRAKARADRDFIDAVRGGEDRIRVPYATALVTHRVCCAIVESAASGRPVALGGPDAAPAAEA